MSHCCITRVGYYSKSNIVCTHSVFELMCRTKTHSPILLAHQIDTRRTDHPFRGWTCINHTSSPSTRRRPVHRPHFRSFPLRCLRHVIHVVLLSRGCPALLPSLGQAPSRSTRRCIGTCRRCISSTRRCHSTTAPTVVQGVFRVHRQVAHVAR